MNNNLLSLPISQGCQKRVEKRQGYPVYREFNLFLFRKPLTSNCKRLAE